MPGIVLVAGDIPENQTDKLLDPWVWLSGKRWDKRQVPESMREFQTGILQWQCKLGRCDRKCLARRSIYIEWLWKATWKKGNYSWTQNQEKGSTRKRMAFTAIQSKRQAYTKTIRQEWAWCVCRRKRKDPWRGHCEYGLEVINRMHGT